MKPPGAARAQRARVLDRPGAPRARGIARSPARWPPRSRAHQRERKQRRRSVLSRTPLVDVSGPYNKAPAMTDMVSAANHHGLLACGDFAFAVELGASRSLRPIGGPK